MRIIGAIDVLYHVFHPIFSSFLFVDLDLLDERLGIGLVEVMTILSLRASTVVDRGTDDLDTLVVDNGRLRVSVLRVFRSCSEMGFNDSMSEGIVARHCISTSTCTWFSPVSLTFINKGVQIVLSIGMVFVLHSDYPENRSPFVH